MTITAAADGSALGNPGPNGWAWYIDDANWAAGGSPHGTNNQGELRAVLELLRATAGTDEKLLIECDSRYVIDSVTKWMPGWKRKGWRKSDGGPVLNRDLLEGIDEAIRGRDVEFSWVKGHAGHPLNEAADERANAAAKAYQQKQEPRRGPGFTRGTDAGAAVAASAPVAANAPSTAPAPASGATSASPTRPSSAAASTSVAEPLWAEPSDLLDGLDAPEDDPIELRIPLSSDEHARLRDRAEAQGISLEEALRRLI
ncbi:MULTISPECIES: ribonuclease H [unclassified Microbacterium]|uniref:ribonuclease H family protein n=1 Tax=unclassified Microbacterium TaxID=2609290 RepID=UPI001604FD53|nr:MULTISPECIES: ribonuclease H [unclassified Microbacterium]QNA91505.1 ribonuclease HI [Microbacterium sp. Se63.02b]QYM64680.1 ribonuclease HI [Microbacterium sp. Se5.02b]